MTQKLTRDYPENLLTKLADGEKVCQTIPLDVCSGLEYLIAVSLTQVRRDVITLRYRFNLSCEQCAEMLACSKQNVHIAEKNALGKLRKLPSVNHYFETSEFKLSVDDKPNVIQVEVVNEETEMPLSALGLTTHTYNALRRYDYETVEDILNDWYGLHKVRNLGVGGVFEVVNAMYEMGYKIPKNVIKASEIRERKKPNDNSESKT